MFVSTLATGLIQIAVPLELRDLHASPNEIGITLSMFGLGFFAFEWLWGLIADRIGYRIPLIVSPLLYAASILLLARSESVPLIAVSYFLSSGAVVAAGPVGRSFVGTTLPPGLRATGLALLAAGWVMAGAIGAGAGGVLIEHIPIRNVIYGAAILPVISSLLVLLVFRGYAETHGRSTWTDEDMRVEEARTGPSLPRVLAVTAVIMVLVETGVGGEQALLPLLVTAHLNLSAATAGAAMFAVGIAGGLLLVPGGMASDRWGRRQTMVAGGVLMAAGYAVYAFAGTFWVVIIGVALRALGGSLIWPAATAWISETSPRRRHALVLGIFGEFENIGVALGPLIGGIVWSVAGIQSAFLAYAVAALLSAVCALAVTNRTSTAKILTREESHDRQPDRV